MHFERSHRTVLEGITKRCSSHHPRKAYVRPSQKVLGAVINSELTVIMIYDCARYSFISKNDRNVIMRHS